MFASAGPRITGKLTPEVALPVELPMIGAAGLSVTRIGCEVTAPAELVACTATLYELPEFRPFICWDVARVAVVTGVHVVVPLS